MQYILQPYSCSLAGKEFAPFSGFHFIGNYRFTDRLSTIFVSHLLILAFFLLPVQSLFAQADIQWDRTIGFGKNDIIYSMKQTADGGYIMGGYSDSGISDGPAIEGRGDITLDLLNSSGQSFQVIAAQKAIADQNAEVDISNLALSRGIYLLKVQSSNTSEVLKVLITE